MYQHSLACAVLTHRSQIILSAVAFFVEMRAERETEAEKEEVRASMGVGRRGVGEISSGFLVSKHCRRIQ